jgi:hypothetical protein
VVLLVGDLLTLGQKDIVGVGLVIEKLGQIGHCVDPYHSRRELRAIVINSSRNCGGVLDDSIDERVGLFDPLPR